MMFLETYDFNVGSTLKIKRILHKIDGMDDFSPVNNIFVNPFFLTLKNIFLRGYVFLNDHILHGIIK